MRLVRLVSLVRRRNMARREGSLMLCVVGCHCCRSAYGGYASAGRFVGSCGLCACAGREGEEQWERCLTINQTGQSQSRY